MHLKSAFVFVAYVSLSFFPDHLNSEELSRCVAASEEEQIENALELYISSRQPTGSVLYQEDGQSLEQRYLPYRSALELRETNPECCSVSEPRDADGPIYSRLQMTLYDVKAVVKIKARRRVISKQGFELGEATTHSFPMNSCGEIIFSLLD